MASEGNLTSVMRRLKQRARRTMHDARASSRRRGGHITVVRRSNIVHTANVRSPGSVRTASATDTTPITQEGSASPPKP